MFKFILPPGNVLRKHRVVPNVMVLYVFTRFFYLRSLKAKYRSLVIRKIIREVDNDKQTTGPNINSRNHDTQESLG